MSRGAISAERTADQTAEALFVNACDIVDLNRLPRSLVRPHAQLVDNARVFALCNIAAFDSACVLFRVKYTQALWRPFQAINFADEDGNAATAKDATWTSLLPTPPHPEYISAHVTLFTALLRTAARLEGDCGDVQLSTPTIPGARTYEGLAAIVEAVIDARVNIGYHFRETCLVSQIVGREIADDIVDNFLESRGHRGHHCFGGFHSHR